jgi:hypothetical protein
MSFKHRHKASDAEELLKGFAVATSLPDMERTESASLLSPTSQSSATTVMRKPPNGTPDSKNERG